MAHRGRDTLRFGPMKPVGLVDPRTGRTPYAAVQLRQDNLAGDHFSLVGFQTQLKWGEQARVLRLIPGLEQAEFARFGMVHRNTYINAPTVLLKEIGVGVLNGGAVMFVGALVALIWFGKVDLALVFAVSVVATISAAALIGVSVPLLLERLGFDPAIASSVFVTPTIDAIGFFTFLGIATLLLL